MPAVTQTIPNFIGGVSSQPDEKKSPGQVTDIINGYPDPSYGLGKRNGSQFLQVLYDVNGTDELEDAAWFFINRSAGEAYFGCVTKAGDLNLWNAITQQKVTDITYPVENSVSSAAYLQITDPYKVPHGTFKFTSVQDVTYITNKTVVVKEEARESYTLKTRATIIIKIIENQQDYNVFIDGAQYTYTSPDFPDTTNGETATTAADILTGIAAILPDTITTVLLANSLELSSSTPFSIDVKAGSSGVALDVYQDEVGNAGRLSATSVQDRRVKIINTADDKSSYFVKFISNEDSATPNAGTGYWEESRGWDDVDGTTLLASNGLDNATMPHILINTAPNKFIFQEVNYTDRLVGNETSNSSPSFVGKTISESFINSNRLGFLSADNVILSAAKDFNNFFFVSAQTTIDSDPIDVNCSSIRPADLFAVIPQSQGLVLFSRFEQFMLYSDTAVLTPSDTIVRSISNYEVDSSVDPVDVGTLIMFLSKTPSFTRTMAMQTRGFNEDPIVVDIGKIASEYVPRTISQLISSPQNSFVAMTDQVINDIYFYRFFNNGQEDLMQAWFKWTLPGTIQTFNVAQDQMFVLCKANNQYVLSVIGIAQSPSAGAAGQMQVNPRIEYFFMNQPGSIVYDSTNNRSSFPVPYAQFADHTPIVITIPKAAARLAPESLLDLPYSIEPYNEDITDTIEAGFIPKVTIENGTWYIPGDWSGMENQLVGGYYYDFEVFMPVTYYRTKDGQSDYTAQLTLSRYKFSLGMTGSCGFEVKAYGSSVWEPIMPIPEANYYNADSIPFTLDKQLTVPLYQKNTFFQFKVTADSPFPVSLNSMKWEGQYSPRYYKRA